MQIETCELCLVGTGISGMNALFVAAEYLTSNDRVIVVDKNRSLGGMWEGTYDYVRLHQPYRFYSIGNMPWQLDEEAGYLAKKQEVLDYIQNCFQKLKEKLSIIEYFGYTYQKHEEVWIDGKYEAHISFTSCFAELPDLLIKAKKCIKAFGWNIKRQPPLALSSARMRSVTPESVSFSEAEISQDDKPIYIIGGGKTSLDTARHLACQFPSRRIYMLIGKGTAFFDRSLFFPKKFKRYWGGSLMLDMVKDVITRYNGSNEDKVFDYFQKNYCVKLTESVEYCAAGIASPEDVAIIRRHVKQIWNDYLVDVVDTENGSVMRLRSGSEVSVEAGSWFINCTGYLYREASVHEPYLSKQGTTLSIQLTSSIGPPPFNAYYLSHLWFLGKLESLPIYELNAEKMTQKNKQAFFLLIITLTLYNTLTIMEHVPPSALKNFTANFDLWYPTYRQAFSFLKLKFNQHKYYQHFRNILDQVRDRYQVECGVISRNRSDFQE